MVRWPVLYGILCRSDHSYKTEIGHCNMFMLRPSMSQVFLQPQGLMSAAEGIRLITHAYRANELRINGPQVFMQGVTFPAAPTLHSGRLITMFRSAIHVA